MGEESRGPRPMLQRCGDGHAAPATVPPIVHRAIQAQGQALDSESRAVLEPSFGHDFGKVRVHTGALAAESARAVHALAYTVGADVVFDTGHYAPHTSAGQRLLAHELTHTIQQGSG